MPFNLDQLPTRTKVLAAIVVGLLLVWQVGGWVGPMVMQPLTSRLREIEKLDKTLKQHEELALNVDLAERRLINARNLSLPGEPHVASTLYQHWLLELVTKHAWRDVVVAPGRPVSRGLAGTAVPFKLTGKCRIPQLCDLLAEFDAFPLIHQVARMSIESRSADADELDVSLDIEGLVVAGAKPRTELLNDKLRALLAQSSPAQDTEFEVRRLFHRGYNGPPPPPPQVVATPKPAPPAPKPVAPPAPPPFDAGPHTYLVAALTRDDEREAWLYDRSTNKRTVLHEGDDFQAAGRTGFVLTIGDDFILLQIAGESRRLALGQNLAHLGPAPAVSPATSPTPPVAPAATPVAVPAEEPSESEGEEGEAQPLEPAP